MTFEHTYFKLDLVYVTNCSNLSVSPCVQHKGLPMYNKAISVRNQIYTFQINYFTSVEHRVWKKEASNVEGIVFHNTI